MPATSPAGATVSFPAPLAFDNRPGFSVLCTVGGTAVASPHLFAVGTTPVLCTATDACGNTSPCGFNVTVLPIADLQISQSADQSTVKSGRDLTYTLRVKNTGPFTANGVIVNDPVPSGATFVSAPGAAGVPTVGGAGTVSWNVGTLTSGQSVTLTLTVRVTQKGNSTMSNTVSVSGSTGTPDPNPANNAATLQTKVIGNSK